MNRLLCSYVLVQGLGHKVPKRVSLWKGECRAHESSAINDKRCCLQSLYGANNIAPRLDNMDQRVCEDLKLFSCVFHFLWLIFGCVVVACIHIHLFLAGTIWARFSSVATSHLCVPHAAALALRAGPRILCAVNCQPVGHRHCVDVYCGGIRHGAGCWALRVCRRARVRVRAARGGVGAAHRSSHVLQCSQCL